MRNTIICCLLLLSFACGAQTFQRSYGGFSQGERYVDFEQTYDGGYVFLGKTQLPITGLHSTSVVRTKSNGDTLWVRILEGIDLETVLPARNGNFIVAGNQRVAKLDASGAVVWARSYPGHLFIDSDLDLNGTVRLLTRSGVLVTLDINGAPTEAVSFGIIGTLTFSSMSRTADGGLVLSAYKQYQDTLSSLGFGRDIVLVKLSSTALVEWARIYHVLDDAPFGIPFNPPSKVRAVRTSDQGFVVTSGTAYVFKIDKLGAIDWCHYFYQDNNLRGFHDIIQTKAGGYYLGGECFIFLEGQFQQGPSVTRLSSKGVPSTAILLPRGGPISDLWLRSSGDWSYLIGSNPNMQTKFYLAKSDINGDIACGSIEIEMRHDTVAVQESALAVYKQVIGITSSPYVQVISYGMELELLCYKKAISPYYELPNVITPNGDGLNDLFRPFPTPRLVESVEFRVFNRWGKEVFTVDDDIYLNWDGRNASGTQLPSGLYYYQANVTFAGPQGDYQHAMKGYVQLFDGIQKK